MQNAYKQAMQYSRSIPRQATSSTRSSVSATGRSPSPNSSNLLSFNENEVWMAEHGTLVFSCWYLFTSQLASTSFSFVVMLQVKFKIALCHSALCEHREALHEVTFFFVYLCLIFIFNLIILFYEYRWCDSILSVDGRYSFESENIKNEYDVREAISNIKK